jgi:16S rRNA (guanine1207-N2)-methyltransferase
MATLYPGARVFAIDVNARAVQLARHNLRLNGIEGASLWCGDGLSAAKSDFFDVIACNPPIRAGNVVIEKLFEDAHRGLKIGGELWVVIRTAQGAKSWEKRLAARFGSCETMAMKSGYRILKAVRSK